MKVVEAKIVVLGSQGVGKTSLVVRYIGKMFSKHISPTIGASFFTCNINLQEARVKLQVWDTAGQERFRSMAPMYYRNANAALLVFDITSVASFAAIKSWVKELQSNVPEPLVLVLVGNKADLEHARAVPAHDAARYAAALGAAYTETSALHDQGIEHVFTSTARELLLQAHARPAADARPPHEPAVGTHRSVPSTQPPPRRPAPRTRTHPQMLSRYQSQLS
ncbi:ras-related protein Rab-31-like isoform X8 [Battus philenor]|uniref:ras-related protein Rab-31-like isoform X8 n=1 Tax=Battus philenor TaxID=42288 RepID=UPI0035CEEDE5